MHWERSGGNSHAGLQVLGHSGLQGLVRCHSFRTVQHARSFPLDSGARAASVLPIGCPGSVWNLPVQHCQALSLYRSLQVPLVRLQELRHPSNPRLTSAFVLSFAQSGPKGAVMTLQPCSRLLPKVLGRLAFQSGNRNNRSSVAL